MHLPTNVYGTSTQLSNPTPTSGIYPLMRISSTRPQPNQQRKGPQLWGSEKPLMKYRILGDHVRGQSGTEQYAAPSRPSLRSRTKWSTTRPIMPCGGNPQSLRPGKLPLDALLKGDLNALRHRVHIRLAALGFYQRPDLATQLSLGMRITTAQVRVEARPHFRHTAALPRHAQSYQRTRGDNFQMFCASRQRR